MKMKIGNLTINELLYYFENKCIEIDLCKGCPFVNTSCGSLETKLSDFIEEVGENTLIEVEDELWRYNNRF